MAKGKKGKDTEPKDVEMKDVSTSEKKAEGSEKPAVKTQKEIDASSVEGSLLIFSCLEVLLLKINIMSPLFPIIRQCIIKDISIITFWSM